MSVAVFYAALSYGLIHYLSFLAIPILVFILLKRIFVYRWVYVSLVLMYGLRLLPVECQPITEGRIVELNHKSVLIERGMSRVLVRVDDVMTYALGDTLSVSEAQLLTPVVTRFGFDIERWARIRRICATAQLEDVKTQSKGWFAWLSRGGLNRNHPFIERFRSLIFQSNPLGTHNLWVSLGLIYSVLLMYVKLAYVWIRKPIVQSVYLVLVFMWIGYHVGFPLAWLRVLCFELSRQWIEDRYQRFSVNLLVLLLMVPEGLSQLAFAIPLWMQMLGLFDVTHHRLIGRWLALQVLIQQAFYQSQLGFILLYPMFRRFNKGLIHLGFLAAGFPFLSQVFIFVYDVLSQFEQTLRTYLVIYGRMNTLAWTLLIFWLVLYPRMNRWLHSALACVYMVFVIPLAQVPWVYELSMINVHQGDAFLISAPLNRVKVLIDTGPLSAYARLDTFLKAQGIRQIDYLIITHDDHDHSGSLEKLNAEYALGQVVLTSQNITHPWLVMIALTREDADNPNDNSLVYWTRIHTLSAIFLGDISLAQERQLSHLYPTLRADLVKIAHHGSNTSSSDALFSWIQAKVALIGVGRNRYGHPHPDVIQRLHENQLRIYQSLVHGDVTIYILPWFNLLRTSRDEFLVF